MHMICQMSYNLCKISIYIYGATRLEQLVLYNRPPEKKKKTSNFQSHASLSEETSFCFSVFCVWFLRGQKEGRRGSWKWQEGLLVQRGWQRRELSSIKGRSHLLWLLRALLLPLEVPFLGMILEFQVPFPSLFILD